MPKLPNVKAAEEFSRWRAAPDMKNPFHQNSNGFLEFADPLEWWKANHGDWPILSRLARQYLAVPGTSAPSERVHSEAGLVITDKRNRLSPHRAGNLVFLHENARFVVELFKLKV